MAVEIHRNPAASVQLLIDGSGHARVLSSGDDISSNATEWGLDQYGILNAPWYGGGDKYFGMRFQSGGQTYYGWARVSIPADGSSFTIKDFAYESTPGASITCGDQGTSGVMLPPEAHGIEILQSGTQLTVTSTQPLNGTVDIYNLLGKHVRVLPVSGNVVRVNIVDLPKGMYMVSVQHRGVVEYAGKVLRY
jgi:hypothetical protein